MEDFRYKDLLVVEGHINKIPAYVTYASVVFRETVCIVLAIAAFKYLEVNSADILNALVQVTKKGANNNSCWVWQLCCWDKVNSSSLVPLKTSKGILKELPWQLHEIYRVFAFECWPRSMAETWDSSWWQDAVLLFFIVLCGWQSIHLTWCRHHNPPTTVIPT